MHHEIIVQLYHNTETSQQENPAPMAGYSLRKCVMRPLKQIDMIIPI